MRSIGSVASIDAKYIGMSHKQNNSADNLEWCTSEHNIKHAKGIGLVRGASVMVGDTCFSSMADAARYLGVSIGVIQGAINGKRISCYVNGKPVYLHGQEPRADRPRKKRAKGEHSKPKHGRHVMVDGVEYVSIKDAARALDTEPKNVKRVANGDSVSGMIKGHKVWYSDSEWLQRDRSINHGGGKPSKKVRALSIDNDLMFSSVADAAKYFSVSRKTIRDYATNKREYNGYMFEIVE